MEVERVSVLTGEQHTRSIPIDEDRLRTIEHQILYHDKLIQDIAPDLNEDDREFILSGITPEEWETMLAEEEEDFDDDESAF